MSNSALSPLVISLKIDLDLSIDSNIVFLDFLNAGKAKNAQRKESRAVGRSEAQVTERRSERCK